MKENPVGATESDAPVEAASPRPSLPRTPPRPPAESTDHVKVKQPKSLWVVWSSLSWGEKLGYAALALPALPLALVLGPVMCLHLQLESENASYYVSEEEIQRAARLREQQSREPVIFGIPTTPIRADSQWGQGSKRGRRKPTRKSGSTPSANANAMWDQHKAELSVSHRATPSRISDSRKGHSDLQHKFNSDMERAASERRALSIDDSARSGAASVSDASSSDVSTPKSILRNSFEWERTNGADGSGNSAVIHTAVKEEEGIHGDHDDMDVDTVHLEEEQPTVKAVFDPNDVEETVRNGHVYERRKLSLDEQREETAKRMSWHGDNDVGNEKNHSNAEHERVNHKGSNQRKRSWNFFFACFGTGVANPVKRKNDDRTTVKVRINQGKQINHSQHWMIGSVSSSLKQDLACQDEANMIVMLDGVAGNGVGSDASV